MMRELPSFWRIPATTRVAGLVALLAAVLLPLGCETNGGGGLSTTIEMEVLLTDTVRVGEPVAIRVTARNQGEVLTNYSGVLGQLAIVDFTSTDSGASLPGQTSLGDPADQTVEVMFGTTGTHTITADGGSFGSGDIVITVEPNPIATIVLNTTYREGDIRVGETFDLTGELRDSSGAILEDFVGTLAVSTTDPVLPLPERLTLTEEDAGTFSFVGLEFTELGTQTITVNLGGTAPDAVEASLTWTLIPGPAAEFRVQLLNGPLLVGDSGTLRITATDIRGNRAVEYTGEAEILAPSDAGATIPTPVTFTAGDTGEITVGGLVFTLGLTQSVIVRDTTNPDIRGSGTIQIVGFLTFDNITWRYVSANTGLPDPQGAREIRLTDDAPVQGSALVGAFSLSLPYAVSFEYRTDDGITTPAPNTTGEGMTFFFVRDPSTFPAAVPVGPSLGLPLDGTGMSVQITDAQPREIRIHDGAGTPLVSAPYNMASTGSVWIPLRVEIRTTGVTVISGANTLLTWAGSVPTTHGAMGWTASTGGALTSAHDVRNPAIERIQ